MVEKASEQKEQLNALLEKYRGTKGSVIPVLQQAQEIYGYLPKEVLIEISSKLEVPISQIYGVCLWSQTSRKLGINKEKNTDIKTIRAAANAFRVAKKIGDNIAITVSTTNFVKLIFFQDLSIPANSIINIEFSAKIFPNVPPILCESALLLVLSPSSPKVTYIININSKNFTILYESF